jgi:two-component system NtrC family sensor kinase
MAGIVQHYLSRTRPTAGREQEIDFSELVHAAGVELEPRLREQGIELKTELEALPPLVADGPSLQRVITNLLNNAIDAMAGGGTVSVTTRRALPEEAPEPGIVAEVSDTGSGIDPELLPHVFDVFFTSKPAGRGTGLGLGISREIVQAHGGTIAITSEPGRGTRVRIFLPTEANGEAVAAEARRA